MCAPRPILNEKQKRELIPIPIVEPESVKRKRIICLVPLFKPVALESEIETDSLPVHSSIFITYYYVNHRTPHFSCLLR